MACCPSVAAGLKAPRRGVCTGYEHVEEPRRGVTRRAGWSACAVAFRLSNTSHYSYSNFTQSAQPFSLSSAVPKDRQVIALPSGPGIPSCHSVPAMALAQPLVDLIVKSISFPPAHTGGMGVNIHASRAAVTSMHCIR